MERVNPKDVGPEKDLLDSDPFNDGKVHRKRSVGARTSTSVHVYVHLDMCVYLYVCLRVCICIHDIDQFKCT